MLTDDFSYLLSLYGRPSQPAFLPSETLAAYRGKLPNSPLDFWQECRQEHGLPTTPDVRALGRINRPDSTRRWMKAIAQMMAYTDCLKKNGAVK